MSMNREIVGDGDHLVKKIKKNMYCQEMHFKVKSSKSACFYTGKNPSHD